MFTNNMLRSSIHSSVINGLENDPDYRLMKESRKISASKSRESLSEFGAEYTPDYALIRSRDSIRNTRLSSSMQNYQSLKNEMNSTDSLRTIEKNCSNDEYDGSDKISRSESFCAIDVLRGNLAKTQSSRDLVSLSRRNSCAGQF